jgi:hypothetical protein
MSDSSSPTERLTHHWTELQGNKYLTRPTASMLNDGGCSLLKFVSVVGESNTKANRNGSKQVTYDKAYVVAWFRTNLGEFLRDVPRSELLKLLTAAKNG